MPESLTPQFNHLLIHAQADTHRFSRFEKSLKMPYLNFGRGLVVSIAHFNCLPSSLHCTSVLRVHTQRWRSKRSPPMNPSCNILKTLSAVGRNIWLQRHWFLLGLFVFRRTHSARKVYLPCVLQPQETHTPWYMWDEKQKHTHTHTPDDGARRRFLQIVFFFFHIRLMDPMRQAVRTASR